MSDEDEDDDDAVSIELPRNVRTSIELFDRNLIRQLALKPNDMHKLRPREFEYLVAEILRDMGADIEVTPATRDGGVDILASFPHPLGSFLTVVECKKYNPKRPVGVELVERFVCTLRERTKANCGLIATTSRFTPGGEAWQRSLPWQLRLAEFEKIREWLNQYGKWSKRQNSQIWLPK